jgi:choline/ethanolamine kinase
VDWDMENEIFESLSDQSLGPKLYHRSKHFRIEEFFLSRPITIFEMRNTLFLNIYAEKICDFNHNPKLRERVLKYLPITSLYVDQGINLWHKEVVERLPTIRDKYSSHPNILKVLETFEKTFLFPSAQDHFKALVPRDSEIVLSHNDAQENNILASLANATRVIFIDFEYTGWNPRAMDLANYFNETMLDNAYPLENGIKVYLENFISDREQEQVITRYLSHYHKHYYTGKDDLEAYVKREMPKVIDEVCKCLLLNNYFWAIWSLRMLKEEKLGDPNVFNFDFAQGRVEMYNHVKSLYFKG